MKNNKIVINLFICMILLLFINIVYEIDITTLEINKTFNEISNEMPNNSLDTKLDKKKVLSLIKSNKKDFKNKNIIAKSYYMESYVMYSEKKYEKSINKLNEALVKLSDRKKYSKTKFEIYKLKYINYIKLKDIKNIRKNFEEILKLTEKYKLYNEFIELCINSSNELLELDDGVNLASKTIDEAILLLNQIKNNETKIKLLKSASNIYMIKDQLDISLKYLIEALDICITNNLSEELRLSILVDMSGNYILQENYEDAIEITHYIIKFNNIDYKSEIDVLSYMSVAYVECGKYKEAEKILDLLINKIENNKKIDENLIEANRIWIYTGYADLYIKNGEYSKAESYLKKLSEIYPKYKEISFSGSDINILIEYGDLYYALGDYEKALECHKKAYSISEYRDIKSGISVLMESISNDYYKLAEHKKSYEFLKEVNEMYHNEFKKINYEKSNNVYNNVMLEYKNEKIEALNKNKIIMKVIIIGLILITITGYINIKIIKEKKEKIKLLNDKLQEQTLKDTLTGLYNRYGLREYIENFEFINGISRKYAFFMIDIDYFKLYNDNYGHIKGDKVLSKVAKCLNDACENHFVARYGGEEFMIIMKYTKEEDIKYLSEKLQNSIKSINIEHKYSLVSDRITLSIGSCSGKFKKSEISNIINQADIALYNSKREGRNRYTNNKFKSNLS